MASAAESSLQSAGNGPGTSAPRAGWKSRSGWLLPVILLAIAPGCGNDGPEGGGGLLSRFERGSIPARQPDFQGVVTLTGEAGLTVAVDPLAEEPSPRADVRLSPQTEILFRGGSAAQPDDLTLGQTVSVWFTEPVGDAMEMDGLAAAIVIEPMSTPGTPGR